MHLYNGCDIEGVHKDIQTGHEKALESHVWVGKAILSCKISQDSLFLTHVQSTVWKLNVQLQLIGQIFLSLILFHCVQQSNLIVP